MCYNSHRRAPRGARGLKRLKGLQRLTDLLRRAPRAASVQTKRLLYVIERAFASQRRSTASETFHAFLDDLSSLQTSRLLTSFLFSPD